MLAREGAAVAICGRHRDAVDTAAAELNEHTGGKVKGKVADVRSHEQVTELFKFIDEEFGGLDVLVNNAGVGVFGSISELSVQDWNETIETNLTGAFYCCREALLRFGTRGGGYIVNISSLAGKNALPGGSAYNASKFALNGFSEAVMLDKRSENVRVSYIMPGQRGNRIRRPWRRCRFRLEDLARRHCRNCTHAPSDPFTNIDKPGRSQAGTAEEIDGA